MVEVIMLDDWRRDWLHHVGADTAFPQDGRKTEHHDGELSSAWVYRLHCSFDYRRFDTFMGELAGGRWRFRAS